MQLRERLNLALQDGRGSLAMAVAHCSRSEARAIVDTIQARADWLWAPGSEEWASYWVCMLTVFQDDLRKQPFSPRQIGEAESALQLLTHRAGEMFASSFDDFATMMDGVSPQGAARMLARIEKARQTYASQNISAGISELDAISSILDASGEAVLRRIAARGSPEPNRFDVMEPKDAWRLLAERVNLTGLGQRFLDYYAGQSLWQAAEELAPDQPDIEGLLHTAGLLPYRLRETSILRRELLLFTPLRLGERLNLRFGKQTAEMILGSFERLSGNESLAVLRDLIPVSLGMTASYPRFHFGAAVLYHLRRDEVELTDDLNRTFYQRIYPDEAAAFQRKAVRALFRNAGVPDLQHMNEKDVRAVCASNVSCRLAEVALQFFDNDSLPIGAADIGAIFKTQFADSLMNGFVDAAMAVPSLQEQAVRALDRGVAWRELVQRVGHPELSNRTDARARRIVASVVANRAYDGVAAALVRCVGLDGLVRLQKDHQRAM
jgi:hypothetical protein